MELNYIYNQIMGGIYKKGKLNFSYDEIMILLNKILKDKSVPYKYQLYIKLNVEQEYQDKTRIKEILNKLLISYKNENKFLIPLLNIIKNQDVKTNEKLISKNVKIILIIISFLKNELNEGFNIRLKKKKELHLLIQYLIIVLHNLYRDFEKQKITDYNEYELITKNNKNISIPFSWYKHDKNPYLNLFRFNHNACSIDSNIARFKITSLNILYNDTIENELSYNSFLEEYVKDIISEEYYNKNLLDRKFNNLDYRLSGFSQIFHNINSDILTFQEIDITDGVSMYEKLYENLNQYVNKYYGKFFIDNIINNSIRGLAIFWNHVIFDYVYSTTFKISDIEDRSPRMVGLVILKHKYSNQNIIVTTCKMTANKIVTDIPDLPIDYQKYSDDYLNFFKQGNNFNLKLSSMGLDYKNIPIIFTGDVNNRIHNPIINNLIRNNFESIYFKDGFNSIPQLTTSKGEIIIDYILYNSGNYNISLGCKLEYNEYLVGKFKLEYFRYYLIELLELYKKNEKAVEEILDQLFSILTRRGLFIPNKNYFSDHFIIGGIFNINIPCNNDNDCYSRKLSKCRTINSESKICIKRSYEVNLGNYTTLEEISYSFEKDNNEITTEKYIIKFFEMMKYILNSDFKKVYYINEINKKRLNKEDLKKIRDLMIDLNEYKLNKVVNIIFNKIIQGKSNLKAFQYYMAVFIKYFENQDYKNIEPFFFQMDFFTKEYNIVILIITLIWKINNYFLNFKYREPEIDKKTIFKINNLINVIKILGDKFNFIFPNVILSNCRKWMKPDDKLKRNLNEIIDELHILVDDELRKILL
jgi:hypothetical protein